MFWAFYGSWQDLVRCVGSWISPPKLRIWNRDATAILLETQSTSQITGAGKDCNPTYKIQPPGHHPPRHLNIQRHWRVGWWSSRSVEPLICDGYDNTRYHEWSPVRSLHFIFCFHWWLVIDHRVRRVPVGFRSVHPPAFYLRNAG